MDKNLIKEIIGWDIVNWSKSFDFWNKHIDIKNKNYYCLEIGARQGGLSLWLALNNNRVVCSDISYSNQQNVLDDTIAFHKKHNCDDKITYEAIDASNIPYENTFDIVVFKSVLGGISSFSDENLEQKTVEQIYNCLKPGGKVVFIENLESSFLHMYARKKFINWGKEWNYLSLNYIEKLFLPYKSLTYKTVGFFGAFGRTENQRQIFGKIDTVIEGLINKDKRYVMIGVAEK